MTTPSSGLSDQGPNSCRGDALEKEDAGLLLRAGVDGQKLPRAIALIGLPMYMKSLRWALVVMAVLLAVSAVTIVALASRTVGTMVTGAVTAIVCDFCVHTLAAPLASFLCMPCFTVPCGSRRAHPKHTLMCSGTEDCKASPGPAVSSVLALMRRGEEPMARTPSLAEASELPVQDFLSRHPVTTYSWVGAQRGPQGWHWIDGTPLLPQLLPKDHQDNPDLHCGGLKEGKLVALNCSSPRPWVCVTEAG
ncbi:Killer cell lectin-like receptor subfamily G member 2 [Tupaia chinensis]|uniref:Killer cell lectin-like receptor subfamily G member 2 n=1 Tax=Tupaia chinensis TaxID=246437 RepID=L9L0T6_TUPCH|nr:Killer cell lectin-like receptor subfamily G member 2 [Tupaia chinensis]